MTFDATTVYHQMKPIFGEKIKLNELLSRHCTFAVGGPADIWLTIDNQRDLTTLVHFCGEQQYPLLIVGNGTNTLFSDAGVRGIVAKVAISDYTIKPQDDERAILEVGAGISWPKLINDLTAQGWGGLEFGPGIPGTLGGGVVTNAGAHNGELGNVLEWIEVLDARGIGHEKETEVHPPIVRRYPRNELGLSYRHSRLRADRRVSFNEQGDPIAPVHALIEPEEIVLRLHLHLHKADPIILKETVEKHKLHRKQTQPPQSSGGSVFKNPPNDYAGRLIEQVGLKGLKHGKAQISERHANFIVNLGGASAANIVALIKEAHRRVLDTCGVDMELEIEFRGEWE